MPPLYKPLPPVYLYDAATQTKQLVSLDGKTVSMYVCGPTVYNDVHLGNVRPIILFDVLNRFLTYLGYQVKFVHNITDIDDKIIAKALANNQTEQQVAKRYEKEYFKILKTLNIFTANMVFPRVTDHIPYIEQFVYNLLVTKHAYVTKENVYFDVSKVPTYGSLSKQDLNQLRIQAAKNPVADKKSPLDFALWKKTEAGITFQNRYFRGRPGWHTECVCLIHLFFNNQVDIHGGGVDLKFPHHENENAQNLAYYQVGLARIWAHIGHLMINHQKMAKSLANFILVKNFLKKYSPNTLRWFFYSTGYQNPMDFTSAKFQAASDVVEQLLNRLHVFKSYLLINNLLTTAQLNGPIQTQPKLALFWFTTLLDDFNLPNFITQLTELFKEANQFVKTKAWANLAERYWQLVFILEKILGLQLVNLHSEQNIKLLKEWQALLATKQFVKADEIRAKLLAHKLL